MPAKIMSAALVCAALLAQDQPSPTFKTNTNLLIVNVAVKDKSGKAIEDLKKDQFTLLEDGKPQQISQFGGADQPVTVGIVVDESGNVIVNGVQRSPE